MNLTFTEEIAAATIYELKAGNLSAIEIAQIKQQALEQASDRNYQISESSALVYRACGEYIREQAAKAADQGAIPERVTNFENTSAEVLQNILTSSEIRNSGTEEDKDLLERASYERGRRSVAAKEAKQAAELEEYNKRREIEKQYEQKRQASLDSIAALRSVPITTIRDMSQSDREGHFKSVYKARTEAGHVRAAILNDINQQQAALAYQYGINDTVTFDDSSNQ